MSYRAIVTLAAVFAAALLIVVQVRSAVAAPSAPHREMVLSAQQQRLVDRYADAMSRASVADICARRRAYDQKLRRILTREQRAAVDRARGAGDSSVSPRDQLAIQRSVQRNQTVYNALVASEVACKSTSSSCAAATRAVAVAARGLQFALIEELATTQRDCR